MKSKNKLLTCFMSFIVWALIYPMAIYMLYYIYIKARFGGKHFISFLYHSYTNNGDKLFALLGIPLEESHGLLYIIQAIISVLGLLIFVGLPILLIPGILLAIANKVSEVTTVIRKNAWCDYCQAREDALQNGNRQNPKPPTPATIHLLDKGTPITTNSHLSINNRHLNPSSLWMM